MFVRDERQHINYEHFVFEYDCLGPKRLLTASAAEGTWSCVSVFAPLFLSPLRCLWSLTRLSLISIRFGAFLMLYSYFLEIQNHTESLWRALAPNLSFSSNIPMSKMSQTTSDKIQASFLILFPPHRIYYQHNNLKFNWNNNMNFIIFYAAFSLMPVLGQTDKTWSLID